MMPLKVLFLHLTLFILCNYFSVEIERIHTRETAIKKIHVINANGKCN